MIVAVGNPVFDLIEAPGGHTPQRTLSGCSTIAAVTVAKLGGSATLVGRVGDDFRGILDAALERHGVDARLERSATTAGFRVVYDPGGNRTLHVLGVAGPIATFPQDLLGADAVLFGPILGETPASLVRGVRANSAALLMLDPQGLLRRTEQDRVQPYRHAVIDEVLPMVDIVKANAREAGIITNLDADSEPERAARALRRLMGPAPTSPPRIAIVTLADAGSILFDGERLVKVPAFRTTTADPTGAGDAFAAGFLYGLARSPRDLRRVGCFAAAVASTIVETVGADAPLTLAEAERRTETLLDSH